MCICVCFGWQCRGLFFTLPKNNTHSSDSLNSVNGNGKTLPKWLDSCCIFFVGVCVTWPEHEPNVAMPNEPRGKFHAFKFSVNSAAQKGKKRRLLRPCHKLAQPRSQRGRSSFEADRNWLDNSRHGVVFRWCFISWLIFFSSGKRFITVACLSTQINSSIWLPLLSWLFLNETNTKLNRKHQTDPLQHLSLSLTRYKFYVLTIWRLFYSVLAGTKGGHDEKKSLIRHNICLFFICASGLRSEPPGAHRPFHVFLSECFDCISFFYAADRNHWPSRWTSESTDDAVQDESWRVCHRLFFMGVTDVAAMWGATWRHRPCTWINI